MNFRNSSCLVFLVVTITLACSTNKDHQTDAAVSDSSKAETIDSTQAQTEAVISAETEQHLFAGEYLVGDGDLYIVPAGDTYEMQDGTGKATDVFYFQGLENDTLNIYSNKNKSITFKMNPDHKAGRYYTSNEQLPVEYVGPLP